MSEERFNDIFNECLDGLLAGKMTIEQCLQKYPQDAAELAPLLRTAVSVNAALEVKPPADARAHVAYRLQLSMAAAGKPIHRSLMTFLPRWAMASMAVLLIFVLGGGAVWAADSSMPDSPLYRVKIATEDVRLNVTNSPAMKAELYAKYADRRIVELSYTVDKGNTKAAQVERITERYAYCVSHMSTLPINGAGEPAGTNKSAGAVPTVPSTTSPMMGMMNQKISVNTTTESFRESFSGRTGGEADIEIPGLYRLSSAERARILKYLYYMAATHPQEMEKFLDKLPEQSKPAVRRMMLDAKEKYQLLIHRLEQ